MRQQYVRTIKELVQMLAARNIPQNKSLRVLEIGSFLGVVCIALRKLGFDVTAQDIPEFQRNERMLAVYRRHGIKATAVNLNRYSFPYDSTSFDLIVMCEVLEHLNFNPLPVVKEINRVLTPGGLLYLTVPNQLCANNRLKSLRGRSIQASVKEFFDQLNPNMNMIVGLHWREYSKADIYALLSPMGFRIESHYFYQDSKLHRYLRLKLSFKDLLGEVFPSMRPIHVVLAQKIAEDQHAFAFIDSIAG
jgi:SAM-dependent methyltransferase